MANKDVNLRKQRKHKQLLAAGLDNIIEQETAQKTLKNIMKMAAPSIGVKMAELNKLKDYKFTHGRGWGENPLDKSKEKVPNSDKISSICIKTLDLICLLRRTGNLDWLNEYLDAFKEYGINIEIDTDEEKFPQKEVDFDLLEETLNNCAEQQEIIEKQKEIMKDVLAQKSEDIDFVSKSSYGKLVKTAYKITNGENVAAQVEAQKVESEKTNTAYENLLNEEFMQEVENIEPEVYNKALFGNQDDDIEEKPQNDNGIWADIDNTEIDSLFENKMTKDEEVEEEAEEDFFKDLDKFDNL